jgi:TatD DNase family protein
VLETDSPYLSPVPKRGTRNQSAYLYYINEFLAKLFNINPERMAEITCKNALELFNTGLYA